MLSSIVLNGKFTLIGTGISSSARYKAISTALGAVMNEGLFPKKKLPIYFTIIYNFQFWFKSQGNR